MADEVGLAYLGAQQEVSRLTGQDEAGRALKMVSQEHDDNREKMMEVLGALRVKAPNSVKAFQLKFVSTELLRKYTSTHSTVGTTLTTHGTPPALTGKQRHLVEHMLHDGELFDLDVSQVRPIETPPLTPHGTPWDPTRPHRR
jgi:hypothetical protein